jgi:nitroreductase
MEAIECITSRSSIRKFSTDQVSKEIISEIVRVAQWSPSYKNSQPWEVVAVSGSRKEALSAMLLELLESNAEPTPDIPTPACWPEPVRVRINDLMVKRSAIAGIDLNAPESVHRSKKANFRFYGAPCGLFIFQDSSLGEWSILDAGMFIQSLMLAAHAKGVATVPQAFLADYAKEIKSFLGIPDTKRLLLGISLGYPGVAIADLPPRPERIPPEEMLTFIDA